MITVKAELAGRLMQRDPDRAEAEIADVERLARDALADVRRDGRRLPRGHAWPPSWPAPGPRWTPPASTADLPAACDDVPPERRELFGWAVREGVTNVVRHSGRDALPDHGSRPDQVEIADDGRGPCRAAAASSGGSRAGRAARAGGRRAARSPSAGPSGGGGFAAAA